MKLNKSKKIKATGSLKNEKGQGATEYILLLLVVVALAVAFRGQIQTAVEAKLSDLSGEIGNFGK